MAILKMDPNEARGWTEHGFLGGIIVGAAWAVERFLLRKPAPDSETLRQRPITLFDVREHVLAVDRRIDVLVARMDAFINEEHTVHVTIVGALSGGLDEIRNEIRDLRTTLARPQEK